jgi:predicted PurR-regulated permease PerM
MTLKRQLIFWVLTLVVFILFLWLLADVLLSFVAGMVLAYLLDPLVGRIQRLGIGRAPAAILLLALVIVIVAILLIVMVPILAEQVIGFIDRVPQYIAKVQTLIAEPNRAWLQRLIGERLPDAEKQVGAIATQAAGILAVFAKSLWSGGKAVISVISLIVITPIVTFYLLLDWERTVTAIDNWIPRPHRETVRSLAREIDAAVAGFIRGQALCCVILGVLYCGSLMLLGLNFALLIGITAGILSFIPYVGTIVGLLLSAGVALAQFWPEWWYVVIAIAIFAAGQFIEGNILQPYFVGKSIGLPPVWLMFSLLAFGYLFGFVGLLVAVPVAAAIGVLARFALRQYMASAIYTGEGSR